MSDDAEKSQLSRGDLKTIDRLLDRQDLPEETRGFLTELKEKVEEEVDSWREKFRRGFNTALKGALVIGSLAVAGYVGKQAVDAFPQAAESAIDRELGERKEVIVKMGEKVKASGVAFRDRLLDFAWSAGEQLQKPQELFRLGKRAFSGVWEDGGEALTQGDLKPDQIMDQMKIYVKDNPVLSKKFAAAETAYRVLEADIQAFNSIPEVLTGFTEKDMGEFWRDYRKALWSEMLGEGDKLTSAPEPESQE